jgi:hypothetical protein
LRRQRSVVAAQGGRERAMRRLKFQRTLEMDPSFGSLERPVQIHADLGFRSRPEKNIRFRLVYGN